MKKILVLAVAASALLFNSCTIEKRHYSRGYYIDRHGNSGAIVKHSEISDAKETFPLQSAGAIARQDIAPAQQLPAVERAATTTPVTPVASETKTPASITPVAEKTVAPEQVSVEKATVVRKAVKKAKRESSQPDKTLYIVLAILIPWLAVGLVTNWNVRDVVINLLLCLTCIGGIIHAIIVVNREM